MNANELRIGNLVGYRKRTISEMQIGKITGIDKTYVEIDEDILINRDKGINGIPITEEWLMKLGFKTSPAANSTYLSIPESKSEIHFENFRNGLVCVLYSSVGSFIPKDINYIHEIQNLCHALTGVELTIKEEQ